MSHEELGERTSASPSVPRRALSGYDLAIYALLAVLGILQIIFVERAPDFQHDDVFYFDAARSLIQHHFYGINGHPETNMPPGLSGIIALMCLAGVCSHVAILRVMAGLQTAGFLVSYAFLRRVSPRGVAAAICLLLLSSPVYFSTSTETLVAYFPYFVATMGALLVASHMESARSNSKSAWWTVVLAVLSVTSLMMASVAIALIGGLLVRAAILFIRRDQHGMRAARGFLIAATIGLIAQGVWMHRRPAPLEWPIAGYPRPYLQQILVRSGNDPELGMASPRDFVARAASNARDRTSLLSELLVHHWIDKHWASPAVGAALLLIIGGWISSIRKTGGEVHDWYFIGHEFIYLLWPWSLEYRFFLPVAPLACLYLWRGLSAMCVSIPRRPRAWGVGGLSLAVIFATGCVFWIREIAAQPGSLPANQAKLSLLIWSGTALITALLAWRGTAWHSALLRERWDGARLTSSARPRALALASIAVFILVTAGLAEEVRIARANTDLHSWVNTLPPDAEAGIWLHQHTDPHAVVMARHLPTTYHFSGRREVWFPPSTNAALLMDGIRRLKVDYIVVVHRQESYYLPPDDSCFDQLLRAYPRNFRRVFANSEFTIFKTADDESRPHQAS